MDKKIKTIILISTFVFILTAGVLSLNYLSKIITPERIINETNIKASDFTVTDINGAEVNLYDFIGKPVVLNFWASWCPPCKSEMPDFNKLFTEIDDVQFIMVCLTDGARETVKTGSEYVREQGYSFPIYFDTATQAANAFIVRSIPATFFIDSDGYIKRSEHGMINEEILRDNIKLIREGE